MSDTASGADVDLDHDRAWRTASGHADRVLHADPECPALNQAETESITEADPDKYRPLWNWCKRCSDAPDNTDQGRAGEQNYGTKLASRLAAADSLDDLREGQA